MKVLFAVSNEEISESIVKKYQKEYKEIISYKNVYYFNAILKEIQKDKSYDRIVISEELETFTHTQYTQIDNFIFERLDNISDEASNSRGDDTPIILICSDRRVPGDQMMVKLFGIGVYDAIIGKDRSVDEVCRLINKPRLKREAKSYYKLDVEEVNYQSVNENDVNEVEIQNIITHYKNLGKNEEKYIESFNNIAAQYNDAQLRIISKFLPLNVRAVLEGQSSKYQQIMSFNNTVSNSIRKTETEKTGPSETLLKPKDNNTIMTRPVVIPSSVKTSGAIKLSRQKQEEPEDDLEKQINNYQSSQIISQPQVKEVETYKNEPQTNSLDLDDFTPVKEEISELEEFESKEVVPTPVKRGRGRPKKEGISQTIQEPSLGEKRGRGRPKKETAFESIPMQVKEEPVILPGFDDYEEEKEEPVILPGFDEPAQIDNDSNDMFRGNINNNNIEKEEVIMPGLYSNEEDNSLEELTNNYQSNYNNVQPQVQRVETYIKEPQIPNNVVKNYIPTKDISHLFTQDKKVATFVGTSKNGTSFILNNIAVLLSSMGINTAILDATQNRNSYYIYTNNEESLRKVAETSINGLANGIANGIQVNKNLTVYTSLPEESEAINCVDEVLETLLMNYSVVLIDCDFDTPFGYFKQSQETYLIQTMDVLTIQPLTAFLRELKSRDILDEEKLRIVLNKVVRLKGINEKTIIGGLAFYNDPSMSFMTELFNRNSIRYISVPFDEEVYIKYLEGIINCVVDLKGYSKNFIQILKQLSNMIYPQTTVKNTEYKPPAVSNYNNQPFSPSMNDTLDQMKKKF